MDSHDPRGYNGHCPICQAQLILKDGMLACPDPAAHFQIRQNVFELAWLKYDKGAMTADNLLAFLVKANIAQNRPETNKVKA